MGAWISHSLSTPLSDAPTSPGREDAHLAHVEVSVRSLEGLFQKSGHLFPGTQRIRIRSAPTFGGAQFCLKPFHLNHLGLPGGSTGSEWGSLWPK